MKKVNYSHNSYSAEIKSIQNQNALKEQKGKSNKDHLIEELQLQLKVNERELLKRQHKIDELIRVNNILRREKREMNVKI